MIHEFPRYEHIVRIDYALWQFRIKCGEGDSRKLINDLKPYCEILFSGMLLENHEEYGGDINLTVLQALLRAHVEEKEYSEAEKILLRCLDLSWLKGEEWLMLYTVLIDSYQCRDNFHRPKLLSAIICAGEGYLAGESTKLFFQPEIAEAVEEIMMDACWND